MRKLFTNMLLIAILSVVAITAKAYDFEVDGFYYTISSTENKTVIVSSGDNKYSGDIVIPETVVNNNTSYTVISIDYEAFLNCTNLTSVKMPNTLEEMGFGCFWGCNRLKYVDLSDNITTISAYSFEECISLVTLNIPENVTTIEYGAFSGCISLESIYIPKSVSSILDNAFDGCSLLKSIIVDGDNEYYDSRNSCNAIICKKDKSLITGCMNTVIPEGIEIIGSRAFYNCSRLSSIELPESLLKLGSGAFQNCTGLTTMKVPKNVTIMEQQVFDGCENLTSVELPSGLTSIPGYAFINCTSLKSIIIPESVNAIGAYAFAYSNVNSIKIPEGVISIDANAFWECSNLQIVELPSTLKNINSEAFARCYWLNKVYCYSKLAPSVDGNAFDDSNYKSAILYVYQESLSDYNLVWPWNEFMEIETIGDKITANINDNNSNVIAGTYSASGITYARTTSGDYGSFCLPFDVDLSAVTGISKVYVPMDEVMYNTSTNWLMLFLKERSMTSTITAGTPFLAKLNGTEVSMTNSVEVTYTADITANPKGRQLSVFNYNGSDGVFWENKDINLYWCGTYVPTEAVDGMKSFNSDGSFGQHSGTLNPFRAYVQQTSVSNAKVAGITLNFNDDEATDIKSIISETKSVDCVYNLQGQKIGSMQKGHIYIVNGKKTVK